MGVFIHRHSDITVLGTLELGKSGFELSVVDWLRFDSHNAVIVPYAYKSKCVKVKANVDLYSALSCVDTTLIHSKLLTLRNQWFAQVRESIDLIVE